MNSTTGLSIGAWEDEGGAAPSTPDEHRAILAGTESQVEWAERIKVRVSAEFDRVAASFRSVAAKQGDKRGETEEIIAILEEKRAEVLNHEDAGYFIHDWQDIYDQVRQLILHDPRYQTIRNKRLALRL